MLGIEKIAAPDFSAFISYSHIDSAIAKKLHRTIETYTLPKYLRVKIAQQSASDTLLYQGKIGPIFRDREDLPAGNDLSESVQSALKRSLVLIILCSPAAKQSPWVSKEIELFRKLHPDRPILAAIINGEPADSFPAALTDNGHEPLAADLRKKGDGWRLGFLKLVAGIANVPLDALIQRDAQRRLRRVMALTLLSGIALIAMIGMTVFAIQSRNEAQHQQERAEELITFMLRDLRDELKGASTLRVMTKVNQKAMDYFTSQGDLSNLGDESLSLVAETLHAIGEDHEKRGDLGAALKSFEQAHRFTAELLERDPANPDRIFDHAQSEYWVGYIAYSQYNKNETLKHWERYRDLSIDLSNIEPLRKRTIQELVYSEGNLCALALDKPIQPQQALLKCQAAIKQIQRLYRKSPNDLQTIEDLANRHAWLADAWKVNNNINNALENRAKQLGLLRILKEHQPQSYHYKELLMKAHLTSAEINADACNHRQAVLHERSFRELISELVAHDPENLNWEKFAARKLISKDNKKECNNE